MIRRLSAQKIIPDRFNLELTESEAANGIYSALVSEVRYRRHEMILDKDTREHILEAARWIIDPKGKFGLLMMGTMGNGKTALMNAIARLIAYTSEVALGYSKKKELKVITAKRIARICASSDDNEEYQSLFTTPMLGIDDMGCEPKEVVSYGRILTPMEDILEERYSRQLFTIITTNLDKTLLGQHYDERIYDRLKEQMTIISFTNPSYRK